MKDRLLRLVDVRAMVGLSTGRIYELMDKKKFPSQIRIGAASRWSENEVQAWIARRKAERKAA